MNGASSFALSGKYIIASLYELRNFDFGTIFMITCNFLTIISNCSLSIPDFLQISSLCFFNSKNIFSGANSSSVLSKIISRVNELALDTSWEKAIISKMIP